MEKFLRFEFEETLPLFRRAAAKGHEESIWIVSVVDDLKMKMTVFETFATWVVSVFKDVKIEKGALKEAFAKTEEPLGLYFAGRLSGGREKFDWVKKSAEEGCSWGQVRYAKYFKKGRFVEKDEQVYVEWLEKAANQNNPEAMDWLGEWFSREGGDKEKAFSYYHTAAELSWTTSMTWLADMLRDGSGCKKDWRQAIIWKAKSTRCFFSCWEDAKRALEKGTMRHLEFNQLYYPLGWAMYWYGYDSPDWHFSVSTLKRKVFGRFLDYYCSCVELQQKSIFTFLLFWNRTTGVKGPGQMIAQMVWEEREDNLVQAFEREKIKQIKM
jgi:hypothetical protein